MTATILIPVLLMLVAFLYASVGHGGASGYIAVLTLFSIPLQVYKPVILSMNIIIAGIAFVQFYRAGYFKWHLAWPFLLTSVPSAFIGSGYHTKEEVYNLILGFVLLFPAIRLLSGKPKEQQETKPVHLPAAMTWGAVIGVVSGFLNIGGGIFLSPVIILMGYGHTKDAAGVSSFFIVCNSLAGLAAVRFSPDIFTPVCWLWITAAVTGGILGAWLGSYKFTLPTVRYILSAVLCIAAVKLILTAWH